jgi:hypothetical protein
MRVIDLGIAGAIIGLAAWAVIAQVGGDPVGEAVERREPARLAIGDPLEDQEVTTLGGTERLHGVLGRRATVFYSWSIECKCVGIVNKRLLPVIERWKPEGVAFIAVDGDAKDTKPKVAEHLIGSWHALGRDLPPYGMLLDPTQRLCRQLGFREASQFAIVDANGALRYRGTFDDDLKKPTRTYVPEAIEAVVAGRAPEHALHPVAGYGCLFGEPAKECPVEEPAR